MGGNFTKEALYSAIDASDEKLIESILKVKSLNKKIILIIDFFIYT